MRQDLEPLLRTLPRLLAHAADEGVILGTLGSMELNLAGYPFPGWSHAESRRAVAQTLLPLLQELPQYEWALSTEMTELSETERYLLMERGQLTPTMAARQDGVYLLLNKEQDTECFINDEEHLHLQKFYPGASGTEKALHELSELRGTLLRQLTPAHDAVFGYLSYDPSKSGAQIFFSYLAFLPGLGLAKHIPKMKRALDEMGLFISPLFGYRKKEVGDLWLIHSPASAESQLEATVAELKQILADITHQELQARERLIDSPRGENRLRKLVSEAHKDLTRASLLRYNRMLEALALLRLGGFYGWLQAETTPAQCCEQIARAYQETAPVHQTWRCNIPTQRERQKARAAYTRELIETRLSLTIHHPFPY